MTKSFGLEKIIVSMTSWEKRIDNVSIVIDSILKNTILPDKIVLNLSLDEFPNRNEDLPQDIAKLENDGIIEIEWQAGNTKAFKKIIPTMNKYPHDAIISIDDDFIYPSDFIETFVTKHKMYPNNPLSANEVTIFGVKAHCGCASLVKREFYGVYLDTLIDDEVIKIGSDDAFYTLCSSMNQVKYKYLGKTFFNNMNEINPVDGLSKKIGGKAVYLFHDYIMKSIKSKYNICSFDWSNFSFCNPFR